MLTAVEVCIPGYEDEPDERMQKQRFEVPLPADYQETVLPLAKAANSTVARPESGNVACKMYVVDPRKEVPPVLSQLVGWMLPIGAFWVFQQGLGILERWRTRGKSKRSQMKQAAEEFGKSKCAFLHQH